jgi:hypothetical protein
MDLKDFIRESLVQISQGIEEANMALQGSVAEVNPPKFIAHSGESQAYGRVSATADENKPLVHLIDFDVAIQAQQGTEAGGGMKLSIASVGIGADAKTKDSQSTESRLKFGIPMVYPTNRIDA